MPQFSLQEEEESSLEDMSHFGAVTGAALHTTGSCWHRLGGVFCFSPHDSADYIQASRALERNAELDDLEVYCDLDSPVHGLFLFIFNAIGTLLLDPTFQYSSGVTSACVNSVQNRSTAPLIDSGLYFIFL